jgi:hypothetical protein
MANNTSLFGTPTTTGQVASKNFTTLYSGPVNTIPVEVIGNTTYDLASSPVTGGANLNLVGSDGSADSIKFLSGTNITVSSIDANTIQIATNQDINTTYTQNASATTGGANLNLVGSDATTDAVKFASAGATTVSRTDANTIAISSTDTNTTYSQNASATTGGANLNLVGSDATTDAVKFASSGSVTVSRTDANTITINGTGIAPGSIGLDDLNDVTFGTLAKGQFLYYNGTTWVNDNNITFDNLNYTSSFSNSSGVGGTPVSVATFKNTLAAAWVSGDGASIAMGLDNNSTIATSFGRLGTQYDSTGKHVMRLQASTSGVTALGGTWDDTLIETTKNYTNINANTLYVDGTNNRVGINTVIPAYSFEVQGTAFVSSNLTVHGTTTLGNNYIADSTTVVGEFEVLGSGSTNLLHVDPVTGFTGLNNAVPATQLDVTGDGTFSGSVFASNVTIDSISGIDTSALTTTATTTVNISSTARQSQKAIIHIKNNVTSEVHIVEALALRVNATTALLTTYGEMYSGASALASFTADVSGGALRILATPASAQSTTFQAQRITLSN